MKTRGYFRNFSLLITLLVGQGMLPNSLHAQVNFKEIRIVNTYALGVLYNGEWSPNLGVESIGIRLLLSEIFGTQGPQIEVGTDFGVAGLGTQVTFPLGLVWQYGETENSPQPLEGLQGTFSASLLGGFTLTRPWPQFLVGLQALNQWDWVWSNGVRVGVATGLRFHSAPHYSSLVSPYHLLDIPFVLSLGWSL